ncbi:hypothetical protein LSM04_008105 [Trypanosoma melophagium]|uniref:uncharacterized protein n=1 Tax=Trypanosoma melophagium TaxID=715481 RepID=UPI00351A6B46|nr:hypothetical protein LSM04_008105 [Trypanosoma melophagium]
MAVAVMCDGAPASLKAIGWASVPGHLMQQHDGSQLILLHAWDKESVLRVAKSRDNTSKPSIVVDEQTALHSLSPTIVVQRSLEAIMESKVTRDTLNYKIETMVLDISTEGTPTPSIPPATTQQHNSPPSLSLHTKKETDVSSPLPVPLPNEMEQEAASQHEAEEAAMKHANAVAEYALDRLNHHHAEALVLGSGNSMVSKGVMVGHVSKAVLRTLRHTHPLWFIKTNGCTMRVNTAILRYVVLLVPRSGNDDESFAKDLLLVQYALERRRKNSSDTVSVVVVAEYNTHPEEVERYSQAIETLLNESTRAIESETCNQENEETATATDPTVPPPSSQGIVVENDTAAAMPSTESAITLEEKAPPTADGNEDAAEVQDQQQWPAVSVCQLKPTKQVAEPTLINVSGQVVKFLQRYKTDIIVSPSTLPEELHLALLAMSKQHILVVPSLETNPHFNISRTVSQTLAAEVTEKNVETSAAVTECKE